jgi:hypothetical protein
MLPDTLLQSIALLFVLLVFGQSSLDKIFHFEGNLNYFRHQFKDSPLSSGVRILLTLLTAMELLSALLAAFALFALWTMGEQVPGLFAMALAGLTFVCLIFGQRMAKDYAGAAGIVPYLLVALLGLAAFA